MTHAEECRIRHLPDQLMTARRKLEILDRSAALPYGSLWHLRRSRASARRKIALYEARARDLGAHWLLQG